MIGSRYVWAFKPSYLWHPSPYAHSGFGAKLRNPRLKASMLVLPDAELRLVRRRMCAPSLCSVPPKAHIFGIITRIKESYQEATVLKKVHAMVAMQSKRCLWPWSSREYACLLGLTFPDT